MSRTHGLGSGPRATGRRATLPLAALAAAAVMALIGAVAGAGPSRAAAAPSERRIAIKDFRFSQPALTVPVGATVTWVNDDEEPHTVTARDGSFRSPGLDHAETFAHRFDRPGSYAYFCALHPHMTATIVVR